MRVNEVKIGDVVRSYDFAGIKNCYYEGIVESINGRRATFTAKTTRQVWDGVEREFETVSKKFTTDLPSMGMMDDIWTDRVEYV